MSNDVDLQNASIEQVLAQPMGLLPSISSIPAFNHQTPLTPVVCDDRAISKLLEMILGKAGLSTAEVARRLGVTPQNIRQYLRGGRTRPSLVWFIKLATACGAKITLEFPSKR